MASPSPGCWGQRAAWARCGGYPNRSSTAPCSGSGTSDWCRRPSSGRRSRARCARWPKRPGGPGHGLGVAAPAGQPQPGRAVGAAGEAGPPRPCRSRSGAAARCPARAAGPRGPRNAGPARRSRGLRPRPSSLPSRASCSSTGNGQTRRPVRHSRLPTRRPVRRSPGSRRGMPRTSTGLSGPRARRSRRGPGAG
jgi:hypothetical protein